VAVVGAGAAGLMAAIHAASGGAEVLLLDRNGKGGSKILISGGGRCNILPAEMDESRFVTDSSPNSLRKILRSWPLREQIAFFETELDLALVEETETGKLFPSTNRSADVHDGLLDLATQKGVTLVPDTRVEHLTPPGLENACWAVHLDEGRPSLNVGAVVLATGGLSVPATGSDGGGLSMAGRLGHTLHPTYAALTPLTASHRPFADLSGISVTATVCARSAAHKASSRGGILFTHKGYSGPAILDVSHVAVRALDASQESEVTVQWTDRTVEQIEGALKPEGARTVRSALQTLLPKRLLERLAEMAGVPPDTSCSQIRKEQRRALVTLLTNGPLPVNGHAGYQKAEVTGGGVSLNEVDPVTLQSRRQPGLFLCGEVLDAFGPIGGYNFAWAWATGRSAGIGAMKHVTS